MRVEYADAHPNGLATIVGGLIESNLDRDPRRVALLRPARIGIAAPDADVSVTVTIDRGRVRIANGLAARTLHLLVRADSATLLELSRATLRFGLPDPLSPQGRRVLGRLFRRRLRVEGQFRHPRRLARFARLLSVN